MPQAGEVYDGEWQLLSVDPFTGIRKWISAEALPGTTTFVVKTETPVAFTEAILDNNRAAFNASLGKRWGEGQVAWSMPVDEYFRSGVAEAKKNHDEKWVNRFMNNPDHRAFRRFKGNL